MTWKVARWFVVAVGGLLVTLAIVAGAGSRTATLRQLVTETLADRLESKIDLESFSVDTFPVVSIKGTGLVIRHRGRADIPPLVSIDAFTVEGGIMGLLSRPPRFRNVTLTGLRINIPPGGIDIDRKGDAPVESASGASESPFIIDKLVADEAELRIIPRRQGKLPKLFTIHRLQMTSLGVTSRMPFNAQLTNPIPRGTILTDGEFGPWQKDDPGRTPLSGRYTFNADLSTIEGIAGILNSTGEFGGQLEKISVKGETKTPDFRLTISEQPVPLTTQFEAVVDGTDGDTYLNDVRAKLLNTSIHARGAVTGTRGVKGRTVTLQVKIDDGRIEDLLRLAIKSDRPPMVGDVVLQTHFLLPPGKGDVVDKLRLAGQFDVDGRFTDRSVQDKLTGMSRRARGQDSEGPAENVMSDLSGRFKLQNGVIALSNLRFAVPGARVELDGTYALRSEELMFDGSLRMQATISQAAGGGVKSVFLKIVDPFFRKGDAGTVLPIKVRGTRNNPKFGLDVVKALTPK